MEMEILLQKAGVLYMRNNHMKISNLIGFVFIMWLVLSIHQIIIYEDGVYDCSNMVTDQERIFTSLNIDTQIGVRYPTENKCGHVWLILPFNIPFECTSLSINPFNTKPDKTFDDVDHLISTHPECKKDFEEQKNNEETIDATE